MNEKFFDLKKEKQDRMINAALKIFGIRGYQFASTDDIVREASISKGLLFHYFGSKLGVYTFIYDYSVRFMSLELKSAVDSKETNFFTLHRQIESAKLQVLKNYPYMQLFLDKCEVENVSEALISVEEKKKELTALYESIEAQADFSAFLSEADSEKLRKILYFTVKNLMEEHFINESFQAELLYRETLSYIDLLETLTETSKTETDETGLPA